MIAPTNEIPLNAVGAIQYSASLHGTLASQVCDRPYRLYFVPHRRGGFHIRPHKINGENKTIRRRTEIPPFIVGTGVLDCPSWKKFTFVSKRTVRQLVARTPCPYKI